MGILDNSTNNIILDAVLTNKGRELIARGSRAFSVTKFAVSDDEIDYSIIRKYGRTVGSEKIEKNTAVFEALTNQAVAQKYRCISVSNPNLIRLPSLELTGEGVDSETSIVSIGSSTVRSRNLSFFQTILNESSIDIELRDQSFIVELDSKFLQVVGRAPDDIDSQSRAKYIIPRDAGETSLGGSRVSFVLATKSIGESMFSIFGEQFNKNLISTFVRVSGIQSGAVKEFEVQIDKVS